MPLRPAYRASCDVPGCTHSAMVPHERAPAARAQLVALGWTILQQRTKHAGIVRRGFRPVRRVKQRDVGGGPRLLFVCARHDTWRPSTGVVSVVDSPGLQRISKALGIAVATLRKLEARAWAKLNAVPVDTGQRIPKRPPSPCGRADCNVGYWDQVVKTPGAWVGKATSREDAQAALSSARLVCEVFHLHRDLKPENKPRRAR